MTLVTLQVSEVRALERGPQEVWTCLLSPARKPLSPAYVVAKESSSP